ncbi:13160_t:CDS:1, partial [Racocetra fulgida]
LKFRESVGSKCKSVIFFALDGLGRNIKIKETPNINNIIKNGSLCFEAKAILPTDSGQNWGSILYGIDRDKF